MNPLRPLLLCGLLLGAGCAPKPEPLKAVAAPKLGLTLSVPAHWQESDSYLADDNRFGLVEGGTDGVVMVMRRSPGLSIPRRYPHANGRALSLQFLQTSAPPGGLLKAEEITIAGQRVHCSIEAADRPFPMKILRVMFWNDTDTYDVSAAVRADRFAAKEAACKAALQSIAYAAPARIAPVLREGELSILAALPVSLSAYAAGAAAGARREPSGVPGLPGDIQRIRVQGELGCMKCWRAATKFCRCGARSCSCPDPIRGSAP